MPPASLSLDLTRVRTAYAHRDFTPTQIIEEVLRRIDAYHDPAVWIHRLPRAELLAHAARVEALGPETQPLYGVPFAIKDNIDLAGVPTSAACPEFAYTPTASAPVVARLIAAGAIPIGKTNLDQFATGLVGVRSPHGTPRNPFHAEMIPGGSSSGSACAVAAGLVSFALGTDTAGSGRVPASFQNLVGLKPTRGWLSTRGVVPACRSLDCVSIFALTVEDASAVAEIAGSFDAADPFARSTPAESASYSEILATPGAFRFGVPADDQLEWFGDTKNPALFAGAIEKLVSLGGTRIEIDFAPFRDAARLLYEGPWVAERWSAIRAFHAHQADAIFPVTRKIIEGGAAPLAVDAFEASYKLAALRRAADAVWTQIDVLVLPTAATIYTRNEIAAEPIALNSRLGHYTNFANLLDTAALAVPAGFRSDGLPFGITFFGPAWSDDRLAELGRIFHRARATTLGATKQPLPPAAAVVQTAHPSEISIAVVGAHLTGQPLNRELVTLGAHFVRAARTANCYRLYALVGTIPPKPGLVRVAAGAGAHIEVEVWSLAPSAWARFVAAIPPPLGIGTLQLDDGSAVKGFLAESIALQGAEDISSFRGWRAYRSRPN